MIIKLAAEKFMEKLFLGISNHVVCLDKKTGDQVWKTKLKSSSITNVYYENGCVFAYSGGHLFSLNAIDGSVNWENPSKCRSYLKPNSNTTSSRCINNCRFNRRVIK